MLLLSQSSWYPWLRLGVNQLPTAPRPRFHDIIQVDESAAGGSAGSDEEKEYCYYLDKVFHIRVAFISS